MQGGAVSLVTAELVAGVDTVHVLHQAVPGDLRKDGSGGDAETFLVAPDQGSVGTGEIRDGQAINERVGGCRGECEKSAPHGFMGGTEDVDPVDLLRFGSCNRPPDIRPGGEFLVESVPLAGCELFGIAENGMRELWRQDDSRGKHRACQGAAPGFVDPRNGMNALGMELGLVLEGAGHRRGGKWGAENATASRRGPGGSQISVPLCERSRVENF